MINNRCLYPNILQHITSGKLLLRLLRLVNSSCRLVTANSLFFLGRHRSSRYSRRTRREGENNYRILLAFPTCHMASKFFHPNHSYMQPDWWCTEAATYRRLHILPTNFIYRPNTFFGCTQYFLFYQRIPKNWRLSPPMPSLWLCAILGTVG